MAACRECPCGDRVPDGYLLVREDEWNRQQRARARLVIRVRELQELVKLSQADVAALIRAVKGACEVLGVTDDDEADWPKLPTFAEAVVRENKRLRAMLAGVTVRWWGGGDAP